MRVAVPSWVIPGTYAENLRFLAGRPAIAAVELLFFLYDEGVAALLEREWDALAAHRDRFAFTAHLPDRIGSEHEALVARLSPLVESFVVHPWPAEEAEDFAALLNSWIDRYDPAPRPAPCPAGRRFLVENTRKGRLEAVLPLVPAAGICLDTGHRLLEGASPAAAAALWGDRIGEIHLHAVDEAAAAADGRLADHRALRGDEGWLAELSPFLRDFAGTVDLEVFSWAEAEASLRGLERFEFSDERMRQL